MTNQPKRILFVDDEVQVLQGLKRLLRPMREKWEMVFASSGEEALSQMAQAPFDVIVTDLRMPGINGVELLDRVVEMYPATARLILSGHSDREQIYRSVKSAHQFLAKPCGADELISVVSRAADLGEVLQNPDMPPLIAKIHSLPPMPKHYQRLVQMMDRGESLDDIGKVVAQDIGMTATLLKMVNSAFFGLSSKVNDPGRAVGLMGLDVLKSLVFSHHLFTSLDQKEANLFSYEKLWKHSQAVASCAKALGRLEMEDKKDVDLCYTSGMLHDVGKLVLAAVAPAQYAKVIGLVDEKGLTSFAAEHVILGINHAQAGAYLLSLWGMEEPLVEAIMYHHNPLECPRAGFSALTAVHLADAWCTGEACALVFGSRPSVESEYLMREGMIDKLDHWQALAQDMLLDGDSDD